MRLLAKLFGGLPQDHRLSLEEATEIHATAPFLEALQMSHGDLANLLRTALRSRHTGERTYVYPRDVYDDTVVYEVSDGDQESLYQRAYSVADGAVTLGDPMAVVAVTQYVRTDQPQVTTPATQVTQVSAPAEESAVEMTGELVPLVEKAVKTDGTATIRIITPGQGSSGYYPADVLQRDGPKVFTEGLQIFLDHPSTDEERSRPERTVKDLAGSLTGPAVWREDGLYAPVKFIDSVAPHINSIAAISGMSIRAAGKTGTREVDGKKVRTIESIDTAHSVDVVTRAGAGGKITELLESARTGNSTKPEEGDVSKEELDAAQKRIADLEEREKERDKELARLRETELLHQARQLVVTTLNEVALPTPTRTRLTDHLAADPPLMEGGALDREGLKTRVTEAAADELAYLASVNGGNPVRGMGGTEPTTPDVPTIEESGKRIETALAAL